jgi:ankyrin repeat protein
MTKALPAQPHIDWLKKTAKERLAELRASDPAAKLHQAQRDVAEDYGFKSWRALKAHVDTASLDGQIIAATVAGNAPELGRLLSAHPAKIAITGGEWDVPLMHLAADRGHLDCIDLLLRRGFDVNLRDRLDHASALHWAAQGGHLNVVKRLVEAGADIEGGGDDHQLGVLGWATCLREVRTEVAEYLLSKGALLTIFSAIALDRGDDVRAMVEADPELLRRRMSRNEHGRYALHHAVVRDRPAMVDLLLQLGADANAADLTGAAPIAYAHRPEVVQLLLDAGGKLDLIGALTLGRTDLAEALLEEDAARLGPDGPDAMALHQAVDRRDAKAVRWLIEHGADVDAKRVIYDCNQTALHMCAERGLTDIAALLLTAGADTTILDDRFQADALGWAEYCKRPEVARLIRAHRVALGAPA